MLRSVEPMSCDAVLEGLEAYLDHLEGADGWEEGLAPEPPERIAAIASHLERCPACGRELALAARVRHELRALPQPMPSMRAQSFPGPPSRWWQRPRLAATVGLAAAAALAVALGLPLLRAPEPASAPRYSAAEVAQAEREARYALARLGRVTERAARELRDDVLARHVIAPTTASVTHALSFGSASTPSRHEAPSSGSPR